MLIFRLLIFWITLSAAYSQYYFVTVPKVIHFEQSETVAVSVFGLTNAAIKIWCQYGEKRFSEKQVVVQDEEHPVTTTIKVTEEDVFDSKTTTKPRTIQILSDWKGQTESKDVILSYNTGFLIVQTDKPIYTPQQRVTVTVLALDESKKAETTRSVGCDLISPSNQTLTRRMLTPILDGILMYRFRLPPHPEIGVWFVRSFYKGKFETEGQGQFMVDEYALPPFSVTIDVDVSCILPDTAAVRIDVRAKYFHGKPVHGNVSLSLLLREKPDSRKLLLEMGQSFLERNFGAYSVKTFDIDIAKMLNSKQLLDSDFPENSHLEVKATVYDNALAKEVTKTHYTVFARHPYVFKFSRSKRVYVPGFTYFLKIIIDFIPCEGPLSLTEDRCPSAENFTSSSRLSQGDSYLKLYNIPRRVDVTYVNGEPAVAKPITINMFKGDELLNSRDEVTDSKGRIDSVFPTLPVEDTLTFIVNMTHFQMSEPFMVVPRAGIMQNQIQVEYITPDDSKYILRILNNMPRTDYTGLFLVTVNGNNMYISYKEPANQISMELPEELQHAPLGNSIRLLAFYVEKNNHNVIADSVLFHTQRRCMSDMLSLDKGKMQVRPGTMEKILVRGRPSTRVSVHAYDAALTSMYEDGASMNDMILNILESHDRGCGQGGGRNSAEVFETTGLIVLTNAVVSGDALQPHSSECYVSRRTKRGTRVFRSNELKKPSYMNILASYGVRPYTRSDMRDSLDLRPVQLYKDGERSINIRYPDTVTSWIFQAIGVSEDQGLCTTKPVEVQSFRSFFIQLHLPYMAKRLETFEAKVTLYNYAIMTDDPYIVNVYLKSDDNICYHGNPGTPTSPTELVLPPNSVKTIRFPVTPVTKGALPIKVTAVVMNTFIPQVDVVERKLTVVDEGVEEHIPIQVCLDPYNQLEDCEQDSMVISDTAADTWDPERVLTLNLSLPASSIQDSGMMTAYMQSSAMADIVTTTLDRIESLMKQPVGAFDTTIARLATTAYSLYYLKETQQLTPEVETRALSWISIGLQRSKTFRHPDRSFSTWLHKASSTWLTAFAVKVGCHLFDNGDSKGSLLFSILLLEPWFGDNIQEDGQFVEHMQPVYGVYLYGSVDISGPSFTAYVLVSLLECSRSLTMNWYSLHLAAKYIEGLESNYLRKSTYTLAVSTYALALYNSNEKWRFKRLLHETQHQEGDDIFWGSPGQDPASAEDVEITSYALLAMLELKDFRTSAYIVRWLTAKRKDVELFKNTQEMIICLQALTTYNQRTKGTDADTDIDVSLLGSTYRLAEENTVAHLMETNLPVERGDNTLTVKVTGYGSGRMAIDLRYHRPEVDGEICPFELSEVEVIDRMYLPPKKEINNCNTCGSCTEEDGNRIEEKKNNQLSTTAKCLRFSVRTKKNEGFGLAVVEFGVESSVEVITEDLKKLLHRTPNIKQYDIIGNGQISMKFLIENITSEPTWISFCLNDTLSHEDDFHTRQPSIVHVYDQTNHGRRCSRLYSTDPYRGLGDNFICDENRQQCQCFRDLCVTPVDEELKLLAKMSKRPATKLVNYTCNLEKANYAVLVEIKDIQYNASLDCMTAHAKVNKTILQGDQPLKRCDKMTFVWKSACKYPSIKVGRLYYIIGKNGMKFAKENNSTEYMYPLMDTALVIEERTTRLLRMYLKIYMFLMEKIGCPE